MCIASGDKYPLPRCTPGHASPNEVRHAMELSLVLYCALDAVENLRLLYISFNRDCGTVTIGVTYVHAQGDMLLSSRYLHLTEMLLNLLDD